MRPLLRIPYTEPLPLPKIIPATANTASGAITALVEFLSATPSPSTSTPTSTPINHDHNRNAHHSPPPSSPSPHGSPPGVSGNSSPTSTPLNPLTFSTNSKTLLLTGAGISVASGLADYRGTNGTYTLNKTYRPIYHNEFLTNHESRKRYWARSFLGWTNLSRARPNAAHRAVGRLGELGVVGGCVTQNVDSFHPLSHPHLPTLELHGYLRSLICTTCHSTYPRSTFQSQLSELNPLWADFLASILETGALDTENPEERRKKGLKTNPDGDVDIPGAEYTTFRYPACQTCLEKGERGVRVDGDGAWIPASSSTSPSDISPNGGGAGILKPGVVMFGESIRADVKAAAEHAVDSANRVLVIGSSLATYSAWRLVKRAKERGLPIGVLNIGGVRGEETFFADVKDTNRGREAVRCSENADVVLPRVVEVFGTVWEI